MDGDSRTRQRVWLDHIGKLNDRALHRQRASGMTTWAIATVFAVVAFRALPHLTIITTSTHIAIMYLAAATMVTNVVLLGLLGALALIGLDRGQNEIHVKSTLERITERAPFLVMGSQIVLLAAANTATAILAPAWLHKWPFWVLAGTYLLNVLFPLSARTYLRIKHKNAWPDVPELSTWASTIGIKERGWQSAVQRVTIWALIAVASVPVVQSGAHVKTSIHVGALTCGLYAAVGLVLITALVLQLGALHYEGFLNRLERRVVVEDLDADTIRSEFLIQFAGEPIRDWVLKSQKELGRIHTALAAATTETQKKFAELAQLDPSMHYERKGRRDEICGQFRAAWDAYERYLTKLEEQMLYLVERDAPEEYSDVFTQIIADMKQQVKMLRSRHEGVCAACRAATQAQSDGQK